MPVSHRLLRFPWPTCEEMITPTSHTNNKRENASLTTTRTKPKLFCLFWTGIRDGSLSILHLLQWILYETPLENLSHITFFYINSLNQRADAFVYKIVEILSQKEIRQ